MGLDSTRWPARTGWAVVVLACLFTFIGSSARAQETDLDALMARCLERRNETWRVLHDYVLDERERFALEGPSDVRLFGSDRQYTWYVQDGILVRSPVRFNGVAVPGQGPARVRGALAERGAVAGRTGQKKKDEKKRRRDEHEAKGDDAATRPTGNPDADAPVPQPGAAAGDGAAEIAAKGLEPRFVSEANFLRFRFERGRYFLVGREQLDGRPVLKVEVPTRRSCSSTPTTGAQVQGKRAQGRTRRRTPAKAAAKRRDKGKEMEEEFDRKFNKVSMVTLWIDPVESQIVRYDFENLGLDFFPGQWLVRVGETSASMTMGRYFDGVWLPKAIVLKGDLQVAIGSFDIDYRREFLEYRKAETSARIRGYGDVK